MVNNECQWSVRSLFVACTLLVMFAHSFSQSVLGEEFIVKDGKAGAEIVIAKEPARMTKIAAKELQYFIEKISGAKLSVVTKSSEDGLVKIYLGRSSFTDKLNINVEDLKYDAFLIRSGKGWLALLA